MLQQQLLTLSVNGRITAPVSVHFTRTNQCGVDRKYHRVSPVNINGGDWDCCANKFLQYKQQRLGSQGETPIHINSDDWHYKENHINGNN